MKTVTEKTEALKDIGVVMTCAELFDALKKTSPPLFKNTRSPVLTTALRICMESPFPALVWVGAEGQTFYNDACIPVLKIKHPTAFGAPAETALPRLWPLLQPALENALLYGAPLSQGQMEFSELSLDPEMNSASFYNTAITDKEGRTIAIYATVRVEQPLNERVASPEHLLDYQMIHKLPAAIYSCDANGSILVYNQAAVQLWGRAPEIGTDRWCGSVRIFRPDGSPMKLDEGPMAVCLREGRPVMGQEIVVERPDGSRAYVLPNPRPLFDSSGTLCGAINMLVDITEIRLAQKARQESESRFRIIADTVSVMIWITDQNKKCIFLNKCWSDFTGKSYFEGLGDSWLECVHPDDLNLRKARLEKAYHTLSEYTCELRIRRRDGHYHWYLDHALPRFGPDGNFLGYVGSSIDIQEQKNSKEELERSVQLRTRELTMANEILLKTNQQMEQFAYVCSHDLQEPLRKIQVYSDYVLSRMDRPDGQQEAKKYLEKVMASANRLTGIINALLDYSRLDINVLEFVPVDLNLLIRNIRDDFEALLQEKSGEIIFSKLPVVKGVPVQINQLFYNLVSNALKFCDKKPQVKIREVSDVSPLPVFPEGKSLKDYYVIQVSDNGIGFEQQYAEKIFTVFHRLNSVEKYSGTGIGLAVCRKIMENHKGLVQATGTPGKGAIFNIFLPRN